MKKIIFIIGFSLLVSGEVYALEGTKEIMGKLGLDKNNDPCRKIAEHAKNLCIYSQQKKLFGDAEFVEGGFLDKLSEGMQKAETEEKACKIFGFAVLISCAAQGVSDLYQEYFAEEEVRLLGFNRKCKHASTHNSRQKCIEDKEKAFNQSIKNRITLE